MRESRKLSGIQKSPTRLYSSKHVPLIHFQINFFKSNLHSILTKKKKQKKKNDGIAASYISRNQLLQLCTARTAWSDSVNRSASPDSVTKLVSVLFGKCTIYALVVTKC